MDVDVFLQHCRQAIDNYVPLRDFCQANFGKAHKTYLGTDPRLPASAAGNPVVLVETGMYTTSANMPGKYFSPSFALFFRLDQRDDRTIAGIPAREQMFRLCLQAIQTLDVPIMDVSAAPEYMVEYPDFAMFWNMTFHLDPSDGLEAVEGGAWE